MATLEEYQEYLKKHVSLLEQLGDALTSTDDRLDYTVGLLNQILAGGIPQEVADRIKKLTEAVHYLAEAERSKIAMGRIDEINIRQTVAAATGIRVEEPIPYDCYIVQILRHWPPGCIALVDVAVGLNTRQLFPMDGFVALDSTTPIVRDLQIRAKINDRLWVQINNTDAVNPHTITVTATLTEVLNG